jgi:hypothetical protein
MLVALASAFEKGDFFYLQRFCGSERRKPVIECDVGSSCASALDLNSDGLFG